MFPGFFRVLFQSVMSVPSIPSVPSVPSIPSVRPSECTILFLNRSWVRNLFNHTSKAILIILNIYRFCFSEIMLLWFLVFYRGKGGHQLIRSESRALELKINLEEWTRLQNPFCLCSARKIPEGRPRVHVCGDHRTQAASFASPRREVRASNFHCWYFIFLCLM